MVFGASRSVFAHAPVASEHGDWSGRIAIQPGLQPQWCGDWASVRHVPFQGDHADGHILKAASKRVQSLDRQPSEPAITCVFVPSGSARTGRQQQYAHARPRHGPGRGIGTSGVVRCALLLAPETSARREAGDAARDPAPWWRAPLLHRSRWRGWFGSTGGLRQIMPAGGVAGPSGPHFPPRKCPSGPRPALPARTRTVLPEIRAAGRGPKPRHSPRRPVPAARVHLPP